LVREHRQGKNTNGFLPLFSYQAIVSSAEESEHDGRVVEAIAPAECGVGAALGENFLTIVLVPRGVVSRSSKKRTSPLLLSSSSLPPSSSLSSSSSTEHFLVSGMSINGPDVCFNPPPPPFPFFL
jgi:hypothetical protein